MDDVKSELLADVVQPRGVSKGLTFVVRPHVLMGIHLQNDCLRLDPLQYPKPAQAGGVLAAQHDAESGLARGRLHSTADAIQRLGHAGACEIQVAEISDALVLEVSIEHRTVRLESIRHVPDRAGAGVSAGPETLGQVQRRAENGGGHGPCCEVTRSHRR